MQRKHHNVFDSDYDENTLYQVENMSLEENEETFE